MTSNTKLERKHRAKQRRQERARAWEAHWVAMIVQQKTPAGRFELVKEAQQGGFISGHMARKLLDFKDLD